MKLEKLQKQVLQANKDLPTFGLVKLTWGNVSAAWHEEDLMIIKPSGIDYEKLRLEDLVSIRISDGKVISGKLRPSSDSPTHLEIYRAFPDIGGITHTHSRYATIFSQAGLEIPCLGTTHADHFNGTVPLARTLTVEEVDEAYEYHTGKSIVETLRDRDPMAMPAVLLPHHGPFTWGKDATASLINAIALEEVALMAWQNILLEQDTAPLPHYILNKHYQRKHGPNSYYGQTKNSKL